jgi:hypothetical protein
MKVQRKEEEKRMEGEEETCNDKIRTDCVWVKREASEKVEQKEMIDVVNLPKMKRDNHGMIQRVQTKKGQYIERLFWLLRRIFREQ